MNMMTPGLATASAAIGDIAESTAAACISTRVRQLSRIVTLNDVSIQTGKDGILSMDATARTFRYLDDQELQAQRKAQQAKAAKK